MQRNFTRKGLTCHALAYQSLPRGRQPSRTGSMSWCKTPEGWKIV